uniref:Uncharacterized protein n=1 Tax=Arundo donax TaxID=35708 RepID=A0A0A9G9Q5_ARUDO
MRARRRTSSPGRSSFPCPWRRRRVPLSGGGIGFGGARVLGPALPFSLSLA